MPILPFSEYRPDISDVNGQHTTSVLNVLPRGDGYGPMPSADVFSGALAARCRGLFFGRKTDGSVKIFAGTETKLYVLDNTSLTWTDASKSGGTYSALSSGANWSFTQFNTKIIATQKNDVVQVFDIDSSSAFADLGGSPPQASHVTTVNRFLVLSGINGYENRVQWSGLNAITTWTSGTNYSDYQDLPDGGNIQSVVGGEFGVILQEGSIRRMVFSPGSDIVFQIDRIAKDIGCAAANSVVDAAGTIYFLAGKGFYAIGGDGAIRPIGRERVDRTFKATYDATDLSFLQGCADPQSNRIFWFYRSSDYSASQFNKALVYDYTVDRWAPIEMVGEFVASLSKPGITLEGLGTIGSIAVSGAADNGSGLIRLTVSSTSGWTTGDIKDVASVGGTTEANGTWTITVVDGTHIDLQGSTFANTYTSGGYVAGSLDDLDVSLDDFEAATRPALALINSDKKLCFLTGDNLEATIETAEQTGVAKRMFVRGLYPITDAGTVYGSVGRRENLNATASYTSETLINTQGFCPQRASTRHARAKLRIPAGTTWTYASGVEPDYTTEGRR